MANVKNHLTKQKPAALQFLAVDVLILHYSRVILVPYCSISKGTQWESHFFRPEGWIPYRYIPSFNDLPTSILEIEVDEKKNNKLIIKTTYGDGRYAISVTNEKYTIFYRDTPEFYRSKIGEASKGNIVRGKV
jgi:hypothetical protein